jgi:hypothetical protein
MSDKEGLDRWISIIQKLNIPEVERFRWAAVNSVRHLEGQMETDPFDFEAQWYSSLEQGEPDYEIYGDPLFLTNLWGCWITCSRKWLRIVADPRVYPPSGIAGSLNVDTVVDLGCGFGFTTAALSELFPSARIVGTQLPGPQMEVASYLSNEYGFEILPASPPRVDLVVALEYFEHFLEPVDHLRDVLDSNPQALILANSFADRGVGHFPTYIVDGKEISGHAMSVRFSDELRRHGYRSIETKAWNSRPNFWMRVSEGAAKPA